MIKFGIFNVLVAPFQLQVSMADEEELRKYQEIVASGGNQLLQNVFDGEKFPSIYNQRLRDLLRDADRWDFFPKS